MKPGVKSFKFRISGSHQILLLLCLLFSSCKKKTAVSEYGPKDISAVVTKMTDIMLHDITNPPLAARFFSYSCLAGYEVIVQNDKAFKSMQGKLNKYPAIEKPVAVQPFSYQLATLVAMMETAKKMQPSGNLMNTFETNFLDSCRKAGVDENIIKNSTDYAVAVSKQILAYAKSDGYNKISNLTRYIPVEGEGHWYPTPPAFMAAVEPNFNTVRSFTLDSCSQFKPQVPVAFSNAKGSPFYKLTEAVYNEKINLPPEHQVIAAFWDCNPFAMQDGGHLQYGVKKISP